MPSSRQRSVIRFKVSVAHFSRSRCSWIFSFCCVCTRTTDVYLSSLKSLSQNEFFWLVKVSSIPLTDFYSPLRSFGLPFGNTSEKQMLDWPNGDIRLNGGVPLSIAHVTDIASGLGLTPDRLLFAQAKGGLADPLQGTAGAASHRRASRLNASHLGRNDPLILPGVQIQSQLDHFRLGFLLTVCSLVVNIL